MVTATIRPLQQRHWVYVDDPRTHEVHAEVALREERATLVTTEFPAGSRDPAEAVVAETPLAGEADLAAMLRELEERLAHAGRYLKADAAEGRWAPLPPPRSRPPDLRAHEVPIPGATDTEAKLRMHHFHKPGADDRLVIAMPRREVPGRHVLAELRFRFPHVDQGELEVLHARLTPSTLRSSILREHVEAPRRGFAKLVEPTDYHRAYGAGWLDRTKAMFRRATAALVAGEAERPPPLGAPARLEEMRNALGAPRVAALRARYLAPEAEARVVPGGEHAVRRHIAHLRAMHGHAVAYELSVLEAVLLLEYAIPAQMWDLCEEEGAKLLRYLHGYR